MRTAVTLVLGALALLLAAPVAQAACPQTSLPEIQDEVMCMICGVPLENANGPSAEDQRTFIRERVEKCESKEQIKAALVPHARAEEKVVYDAVIALKGENYKVDGEEGYLEHELADKTLLKLSKMTQAKSPEFSAAAKVLKELLEHHISEEERNIWADVRAHFDAEERAAMNRRFLAAKKKVKLPA